MLDFLWRRRGVSLNESGVRFGGDVQESDAAGGADGKFGVSLHRFYLASCRSIVRSGGFNFPKESPGACSLVRSPCGEIRPTPRR
jgi:hypothetical protein